MSLTSANEKWGKQICFITRCFKNGVIVLLMFPIFMDDFGRKHAWKANWRIPEKNFLEYQIWSLWFTAFRLFPNTDLKSIEWILSKTKTLTTWLFQSWHWLWTKTRFLIRHPRFGKFSNRSLLLASRVYRSGIVAQIAREVEFGPVTFSWGHYNLLKRNQWIVGTIQRKRLVWWKCCPLMQRILSPGHTPEGKSVTGWVQSNAAY